MDIKHRLQLYILSQGADAAPPLGTVLGNLGVNTVNFCKEFNSVTSELPSYLTVSVQISIMSNRSYKFVISKPPLGPLIQLLVREEGNKKIIPVKQTIQLALWQFPLLPLEKSLPVLLGTLRSAQVIVKNI